MTTALLLVPMPMPPWYRDEDRPRGYHAGGTAPLPVDPTFLDPGVWSTGRESQWSSAGHLGSSRRLEYSIIN
jgi:hypothetical protein